jgi:hypothetical protein
MASQTQVFLARFAKHFSFLGKSFNFIGQNQKPRVEEVG